MQKEKQWAGVGTGEQTVFSKLRCQTEGTGTVFEVPATGKASHISSATSTECGTGRALTAIYPMPGNGLTDITSN